ncbi:hypothetical protein C2G38_2152139 [Gigaspora rosea]|uniref:Peptidase S1 domain-containing protein n=1 Tax=Gigaspora rosea TaxID=44941 RepID=A0A397W7H4_9GLOM|nr:hypothetical protein C2G38_2152139 [Gigaspora rosea]
MRIIHFLIILLSSLQNYSIYAGQHHPLAKLWNVDDTKIPELLELERKLITIDEILKPILEKDEILSNFGGSFINILKTNRVIVNTVNFSKVNDLEISHQADIIQPKNLYIYTDMEINNNVIFLFETQSRRDVNIKVKVLGGNGLFSEEGRKCSVDPYDLGAILLEGDDVTPTFSIRNDDADQYKELIITDGAPVSSHGVQYIGFGDSGGPVLSFVSPENLHSVMVHGTIVTVGTGVTTAQSIDIMLENLALHSLFDLELYLGN